MHFPKFCSLHFQLQLHGTKFRKLHLITYPDAVYNFSTDAILIQTRCEQSLVSLEKIFLVCSSFIQLYLALWYLYKMANTLIYSFDIFTEKCWHIFRWLIVYFITQLKFWKKKILWPFITNFIYFVYFYLTLWSNWNNLRASRARHPEEHWNPEKNAVVWDPYFLIRHTLCQGSQKYPNENIPCVSWRGI